LLATLRVITDRPAKGIHLALNRSASSNKKIRMSL
jgi:hypothetical protein